MIVNHNFVPTASAPRLLGRLALLPQEMILMKTAMAITAVRKALVLSIAIWMIAARQTGSAAWGNAYKEIASTLQGPNTANAQEATSATMV